MTITVQRTPGDRSAPGIYSQLLISQTLQTNAGRNFLDENGTNKTLFSDSLPLEQRYVPGEIIQYESERSIQSFFAKVLSVNYTVDVSDDGTKQSTVNLTIERSDI